MSYKLKSRTRLPPGGWQFRQPETGWENPKPMVGGFDTAVGAIRAMRQNNPRHNLTLDVDAIGDELDTFTCARLGGNSQWCAGSPGEAKKKENGPGTGKKFSPLQAALGAVAAVVAGVRRTANGARILADWLGDGGIPVDQALAEERSMACTHGFNGQRCPQNNPADWRSVVTGPVANAVLEQRRVKTQLALVLPNESELGTCNVCLCNLPLKLWTPMSHIERNTGDDVWAELPEWCWMLKERSRQP